jgi:hypothetical protein
MLTAAAAVLLSVPASALAGTRGMTVTVPKSITAGVPFSASYSGDTGPGDQATGGFIVNAELVKSKTCPANNAIPKHTAIVGIAGGNVLGAGAFSAGDRPEVFTAGKYTVCGYVSQNNESIAFDLLYQSKHQVTVKTHRGSSSGKLPKIKDGVYSAATAATVSGGPGASVTFTVTGGHVVSAAATGLPTVSCFPGFSTQTPVAAAATSSAPSAGSSNPVYNTLQASFAAPGVEELDLTGGDTSDSTFIGSVSAISTDGSCTGSFAFTAKRAK